MIYSCYQKLLFALFFLFFLTQALPAVERVRVETKNGSPEIVVDGQAIRARMFYGGPGSRPIKIEKGQQQISFVFSPVESELNKATMHFRAETKPLRLFFDDILVEELDASGEKVVRKVVGPCRFENGMDDFNKDWDYWPTGKANTTGNIQIVAGEGSSQSGALLFELKAPENNVAAQWPDFHFFHKANLSLEKGKKYRVSFWINSSEATELRIAFYRPGQTFVYLGGGGGDFFDNQVGMSGKSGARFVSFWVNPPWPEPGKEEDWRSIDSLCRRILDANPDALLIPRIQMDAPVWWLNDNPDHEIKWIGTPSKLRRVAAVSSPLYRKAAAERLDIFVRYLENNFGPHIGGYHPAGQNTNEWFYQDSWGPAWNGYSEVDCQVWRVWLSKRYENDTALQNAWGDDSVSLSTVEVPQPDLRKSSIGGMFRDIAVEKSQQSVLDFVLFQQEMMADTVLELAKTVRTASEGKRLSVFFYGYVFEFAPLGTSPATSGHYALSKILKSPDIDILCSPISYFDRQKGGSAAAMTAAESVALANKMWLYEDDTRTHLTPKVHHIVPGGRDGADTVEETIELLLRNTTESALRNFGIWWMDLTQTGWFDDQRLWDEMKRLEEIDEIFLKNPTPFKPEVAAFVDELSMLSVSAPGHIMSRSLVYECRKPLARMGTPYGQYLLDDFLAKKTDAKVNVFVSAWNLSEEKRQNLKKCTKKSGTINVWCYAPGFLDVKKGGSIETMKELTGFELKKTGNINAWAEPTEAGRQLGLNEDFGLKQPIVPLFAVADAEPEETLAVYSDGSAAAVLRKGDAGEWNLFLGPPALTSSLLRLAAQKVGVHLFTKTDCNVYANGPVVMLHGAEDGNVNLNVCRTCRVVDFREGKTIGNGPQLTIPLKFGETRIFRLENE